MFFLYSISLPQQEVTAGCNHRELAQYWPSTARKVHRSTVLLTAVSQLKPTRVDRLPSSWGVVQGQPILASFIEYTMFYLYQSVFSKNSSSNFKSTNYIGKVLNTKRNFCVKRKLRTYRLGQHKFQQIFHN